MNPTHLEPKFPVGADPRGPGGLLALLERRSVPFPLLELRVRADIAGPCCRTVIEQRFGNPIDGPLEAIHIFPLPERGAVVELRLMCGDLEVVAECRERGAAEREFASARDRGRSAALLTAERDDVHTLRVTRIPPGAEVRVRLVVVELLPFVDGRWSWRFPTVIAPRYLPGAAIGHEGPGVVPDTDRAPDASRLQPPLRLAGGTVLDLEARIDGPLGRVESSLHAVRLTLDEGAVHIAPSGRATCDRDFALGIWPVAADVATGRAYSDGQHTVVLVEPPVIAEAALPRDAVFAIDVSGSMRGEKLEAARRALSAALHGLAAGDRFRLISFSDDLEELAPGFLDYDDQSLGRGDHWIARLRTRGGTEMLPAVQKALEGHPAVDRVRTVLFITDGEVHNDAELVAAVAHRRGRGRFFALGIDTAVNAALLTRMARVGGGTCELAGRGDDVEAVISRLEARLGGPVGEGVCVEGLEPANPDPAALFAGIPLSMLGAGAPAHVEVRWRGPAGPANTAIPVRRLDWPLGALWARERVAYLEDQIALHPSREEGLRAEIVRVALGHGIASRFTAFVAVERRLEVDGALVEVVQPVERPFGWDGRIGEISGTLDLMPGAPRSRSVTRAARTRGVGRKRRRGPGGQGADRGPVEYERGITLDKGLADAPERGVPSDPAGDLARSQDASGSFGGEVRRTAAALVALVLLGHTRMAGTRRRTVQKAASWLQGQSDPLAAQVLAWLAAIERGEDLPPGDVLRALVDAGAEGQVLSSRLAGR